MKELTIEAYQSKVGEWVKKAKTRDVTHIIVAVQGKRGPFPVYVKSNDNIRYKIQQLNDDATTTPVEVYDLSKDLMTQLQQGRSWNV